MQRRRQQQQQQATRHFEREDERKRTLFTRKVQRATAGQSLNLAQSHVGYWYYTGVNHGDRWILPELSEGSAAVAELGDRWIKLRNYDGTRWTMVKACEYTKGKAGDRWTVF